MASFTFGVTTVVAATLFIAKLLTNGRLVQQIDSAENYSDALQFKLLHLFGLMTISGVVIPILVNNIEWLSTSVVWLVFLLAVLIAVGSLMIVWCTLGRASIWKSILTLFAVTMIAVMSFLISEPDTGVAWLLLTLTTLTLSLAYFMILRSEGYRFAKAVSDTQSSSPAQECP